MSINQSWINWRKVIIDDRRLSFGAKGMALYLNTYMNDSHDMAWPSISTICGELGIGSRSTAIKHLTELEKYSYIQKEKRFSDTTRYHAILPKNLMESLSQKNSLQPNKINSSPNPVLVQKMNTNTNSLQPNKINSSPNPVLVQKMDPNKQYINKQKQKEKINKKKNSLFQKPTIEQIKNYCNENSKNVDAEDFYNFYESNGWMVGKNKMKNWQAAVNTWSGRNKSEGLTQTSSNQCDVEGGCL